MITEAGYTRDLTGTEAGIKKEDMEIDMDLMVAEPGVKEGGGGGGHGHGHGSYWR